MNNKCTLYIDEAGDLGFNRGTQWFVLSGVIVEKNDEPLIRNIMKNIKSKLNMNNIHFRNMKAEEMRPDNNYLKNKTICKKI
jgi:hypothetical protein